MEGEEIRKILEIEKQVDDIGEGYKHKSTLKIVSLCVMTSLGSMYWGYI